MAQMVKNPPGMQETWVQSLGRMERSREKRKATHSRILAWIIPWTVACKAPLAMGFPRQEYWRSSQPRDRTQVSCIPGGFFTS